MAGKPAATSTTPVLLPKLVKEGLEAGEPAAASTALVRHNGGADGEGDCVG